MNAPAFEWGKGGCQCAPCKATNALMYGCFAAWPRGNPAGKKSAAEYTQHCAALRFGAKARVDFGPAGIGFYGVPVGSRAEAERILTQSFATLEA